MSGIEFLGFLKSVPTHHLLSSFQNLVDSFYMLLFLHIFSLSWYIDVHVKKCLYIILLASQRTVEINKYVWAMFNQQPPTWVLDGGWGWVGGKPSVVMWIVGHSHPDPSFLTQLRSPWDPQHTGCVSLWEPRHVSLPPSGPSPASGFFAPRQDWAGLWQVNMSSW